MCGIAGWIRKGTTSPTEALLEKLFMANSVRGREAAGIAWRENDQGDYRYLKSKGLPYTFWHNLEKRGDLLENILASKIVILHTRQPTKGSSSQNENNHPVVYKPPNDGGTWLVVHNGMISNDDTIFEKYKAERYAEVDTASLPVLLAQGQTMEESLMKLGESAGVAAVAAVSTAHPNLLGLYRNVSEFHLFHAGDGLLVFSSEDSIAELLPPTFHIADLAFHSKLKMPDDYGVILSLAHDGDRAFRVPRCPLVQRARSWQNTTWRGTTKTEAWESGMPPECPKKPEPLFGVLGLYNWPLQTSLREIETKAVGPEWTFLTPFGRWVFTRVPLTGTVTRAFTPHKRLRKWMKKTILPSWWEGEETSYTILLDRYAHLEEVTCKMSGPVGGEFNQVLYLCPWCGIPGQAWSWRRQNRRCELCGITSLAPKGGERSLWV